MIAANEWVILVQPDGFQRIVQMKPDGQVELAKYGKVECNKLIGLDHERRYELPSLVPISPLGENSSIDQGLLPNDSLVDDNTAQRLSYEEIVEMRARMDKGDISASLVIDTIISNSDSFAKKNAFSQQKYRQRKESKFSRWVQVKRCTVTALAEFYLLRDPEKIGHLRLDGLGQLVCLGNVFEGQRVMVWDETRGLVLATMAGLNSAGMTIPVYSGQYFQPHLYEHFNLPESLLYPIEISFIANSESDLPKPAENSTSRYLEKHGRHVEAIRVSRARLVDSLIVVLLSVASINHLPHMLSTLKPSSPIVIFAPFKEFLVDLFADWMADGRFVDVRLAEPWMREYQCAQGRCHPMMTMNGHGGYMLSATCISQ